MTTLKPHELAGATINIQDEGTRLVLSPAALAHKNGLDLIALIKSDSVAAAPEIEKWANQAKLQQPSDAELAVYMLIGADDESCTPMQYGGLLLDHDIEMVRTMSASTKIVILYGSGAPYLDLLGSLDCDALLVQREYGEDRCSVVGLQPNLPTSSLTFSLVLNEH